MKQLITIPLLSLLCYGAQDYSITPKGELQFRLHDRTTDYSGSTKSVNFNDYIIGGSFGIQTSFETFNINTLLYGVGRLKDKNSDPLKRENSFYDNDLKSFLFLGEGNFEKRIDQHTFKIGRQSFNAPLVGENHRVTKNSYEGLRYNYKKDDLAIQAFYFNKFASTTLANGVPYNHRYGFLAYGLGYKIGNFNHISNHLIDKKLSTNGALDVELKYGDKNNYISYENLFVDNFFNTSNLTFAYNIIDNFHIKAGAIYQTSVGKDHIENNIEVSQQGKKLEAEFYQGELKYQNRSLKLSYRATYAPADTSNIYNGTLYSPFSNGASFIMGMNTVHSTISDTLTQQIELGTLQRIKGVPVEIIGSIIKYDIGDNNGMTNAPQDTREWFLHLKGYFSKNLSAKIQYSNVKEQDPLREKLHNSRFVVEYKF